MSDNGLPVPVESNFPAEVKGKAYHDFLHSTKPLRAIAVDLGVPEVTIAHWAKSEGWIARKQELEQQFYRDAEIGFQKFLAEHKTATAERQLAVAKAVEEKLLQIANAVQAIDPSGAIGQGAIKDLSALAKALNEVANVSARAVNMGEKAAPARQDDGDSGKKGKGRRPLVIIGMQVGVPAGADTQLRTVEITGEEA